MAIDLKSLTNAIARHGRVVRVVVTQTQGSAPREVGASMLVWGAGQSGTIGGGTLEYRAADAARAMLAKPGSWQRAISSIPLGPALGQCCGGAVTLMSEVIGAKELAEIVRQADVGAGFARPMGGGLDPAAGDRPIHWQGGGTAPKEVSGWLIEGFAPTRRPLWVYGAGHVGRAIVQTMRPLGFEITWVDTATERFPTDMPDDVTQLVAERPQDVVRYAPADAFHLVFTYSHGLDLELCHAILNHAFVFAGVIGSATKWARFRKRLLALGHSAGAIDRLTCPIGLPELGKSPEAIAVGVAAQLLKQEQMGCLSNPGTKGVAS